MCLRKVKTAFNILYAFGDKKSYVNFKRVQNKVEYKVTLME